MDSCKGHFKFLVMLIMAAGLFVTVGCVDSYHDYDAFVHHPRPLVTSTSYQIMPPDAVVCESEIVREIDNHSQVVRPDGRIQLPLLGTFFVAGKTPEEVSSVLTQKAQEFYEDAEVTLRVQFFRSKQIYVFGEVLLAGPFPYNGTNTVLNTLAKAQPSRLADNTKIRVVRPNTDGQLVHKMTINLDDMVENGLVKHDAVLEEGDIVWVPPNPLAATGLFFQQVFLPIQPAASVVKGSASIQETFTGYSTFTDQPNR